MEAMKIRRPGVLLSIFLVLALCLPWVDNCCRAADTSDDYLYAVGSTLYDDLGHPVRLTGIAWFGFETETQVYHGLWSENMEDILDTVANKGFNMLRVPLSVQLVNQWRKGNGATPGSVNYAANPGLSGLTSLQILDESIAYCKQIGLKVMLDMHRVVNTQMLDGWTAPGYPAGDFEACWRWLAQHYADDDTVIAMDLFNEPHGAPGDSNRIKWDDSADANNWKHEAEKVAHQVLDINPYLLIVIEGVEATPKNGYTYAETNSANYDFNWWGGNLRRVKDYPIDLGNRQRQVVYSPHDYGPSVYRQPWFHQGFTQASLKADCWSPNWLYIAEENIAPLLIGEWGGRMDGGDNQKWMGYLRNIIAQYKLNHTFWCVNPNSGDTGGILLDDWKTVDSAKYNLVEPSLWKNGSGKFIGLDHQVNLGVNGTHVGAGTTPAENNSTIHPAAATFDKNTAKQANIAVTMTLNGNTLKAIGNGSGTLRAGTDYRVSGSTVTILKSYLATQAVGAVRLSFDFSAGQDPVLSVKVIDTSNPSAQAGKIKIQMVNGTTAAKTKTILPKFKLINTGTTAIALPTVKIRYYYSVDGDKKQTFQCAGSTLGCAKVTGKLLKMAKAAAGADYTLEVGFAANAGRLTPGKSIEVKAKVFKSDGSQYTQTGDYSFNSSASQYKDWRKVTGHIAGRLAWGAVPVADSGLPDRCEGSCNAAKPVHPTIQSNGGLGNITMYSTAASNGGACNYGPSDVMSYAAIGVDILPDDAKAQWQEGRICGQCAEVTALTSKGPKKVVVRIMDKCPDEYCGIDLGGSAPAKIMLDGFGRYAGKWRFVSCNGQPGVSDGPPTLDVFQGSNPWWSRVQVRNGPSATASITWRDSAGSAHGTFPYSTNPENTFEVPINTVLQSQHKSLLITVHYADKTTATATLSPGQLAKALASYPLKKQ